MEHDLLKLSPHDLPRLLDVKTSGISANFPTWTVVVNLLEVADPLKTWRRGFYGLFSAAYLRAPRLVGLSKNVIKL